MTINFRTLGAFIVVALLVLDCQAPASPAAAVTPPLSAAKALKSFSFPGLSVTGTVDERNHSVAVTVPFGTAVTALVASFSTSGDTAKIGSIVQVSGSTVNDFSSPVSYVIVAADSSTQTYIVTVTVAASSAKALMAFSFLSPSVIGTVNESSHSVTLTVPFGTAVTSLVASFSTSGVSVKVGSTVQLSGTTANDFTAPVSYTVTASDSSTQVYLVTVTIAPSSAKVLSAFSFSSPAAIGTVNEVDHTVAVAVPYGTAVTALVATFAASGTSVRVGSVVQTSGTTPNDFSTPVTYTVTASDSSTQNYVVTVHPSPFSAQWAQTQVSGTGLAIFNAVSTDNLGNIYAVGYIYGTGTCGFGNSVTVTGIGPLGNVLVVKYNASGVAQWARTLTSGTGGATFFEAATDSAGNLYAVGATTGSGTFGFGNSVTVTGTDSSGYGNSLVVKYDSFGVAQWAQTLTTGTGGASFQGVTIDSSGNLYAVGYQVGPGTFGFGNAVTATGTATGTHGNTLIVKYDSSGTAKWAQTLTAGTAGAIFNGVAIDGSGNIYSVGTSFGTGTFGFGNAVTATGTDSGSDGNTLVVKYDASGAAQWARTLTAGLGGARLKAVSTDGSGNIYAVGKMYGTATFGFGNGVTVTGSAPSGTVNPLVVKYDATGAAQWARTLTSGTDGASFNALSTDAAGNTWAAGIAIGPGTFGFGNGVKCTGSADIGNGNTLVVRYNSSGDAQWAQTLTGGTGGGNLYGVAADPQGSLIAVGDCQGTGTFSFGNAVTATGTSSTNALVVKYLP